jgi:phospholipid transport system substrate-binding protein
MTPPTGQKRPNIVADVAGHFARRGVLSGLVGVGIVLSRGALCAGQLPDAASFIETLGTRSVAIMNDRNLVRSEQLGRMVALLDEVTDLPYVARLALGRYWREASEQQRQDYTRLFKALVIKTMAGRLSSYGGETFVVVGTRVAAEHDSVVSTRILRPSEATPLEIDWRVRNSEGVFLVVDIVVEGISMVLTYRSEASEMINQHGIEGLLASMRERLAASA